MKYRTEKIIRTDFIALAFYIDILMRIYSLTDYPHLEIISNMKHLGMNIMRDKTIKYL